MSGHEELVLEAPDRRRGARLTRTALVLIVVGAALSVLAYLQEDLRDRMSYAYLVGFAFVWAIVLGSVFFVALQHITRSVWSVVMRRVAEMLAAPIWVLPLLFVPVVLFAVFGDSFTIFPWANADVVQGDALLEHKAPYLSVPFFVVRTVLFFLIWVVFGALFVRLSLEQDASKLASGSPAAGATLTMRKLAAPFIVLFGLTVTFASFDWLMSLEPHWFSTIYGVYVFSGMVVASLAAITLAVVWVRAKGWLGTDLVRPDHLYNLGALLFAFTCFWAYIAFSQYMLIWYGNLPEETVYFVHRGAHGWNAVSILLAVLRFVVPFALLLARDAKSDPRRLVLVSLLILLGQLVDLYWLVMPSLSADGGPVLGWPELGPPLFLIGVLVLCVGVFLGRHRLVPVGDPLLEKSRNFHL